MAFHNAETIIPTSHTSNLTTLLLCRDIKLGQDVKIKRGDTFQASLYLLVQLGL
jgi:hypothetical protein